MPRIGQPTNIGLLDSRYVNVTGDTMTGSLVLSSPATLSLTALTTGSVLFVGASGVVSEDNTQFFWDDSTHTLVFPNGTTVVGSSQMIIRGVTNGTALVNAFEVYNSAKASSRGNFAGRRGRGTFASQSFANNGDSLFSFTFEANIGANTWGYAVKLLGEADGTVSGTSSPGRFKILTQPAGTILEAALVEAIRIDSSQNVSIGTAATPTAVLDIKAGSTSFAPLGLTSGPLLTSALAGKIEFLTDAFYGTITTGTVRGMFALYRSARATAQTAANASVLAYTLPATDATFLVSANVLVTTATVHNFTVTVAYTDEGNTARTLTLSFSSLAGTFLTGIVNTGGAVPYEGVPVHIRCKASTSITFATTGTFTTVTYNVEAALTQIA